MNHFDVISSAMGSRKFHPLSPLILCFAHSIGFGMLSPNERTIAPPGLLAIDVSIFLCYKAFSYSRYYKTLFPPADMNEARIAVWHSFGMNCFEKLLEMHGHTTNDAAMTNDSNCCCSCACRADVCKAAIGEKVHSGGGNYIGPTPLVGGGIATVAERIAPADEDSARHNVSPILMATADWGTRSTRQQPHCSAQH